MAIYPLREDAFTSYRLPTFMSRFLSTTSNRPITEAPPVTPATPAVPAPGERTAARPAIPAVPTTPGPLSSVVAGGGESSPGGHAGLGAEPGGYPGADQNFGIPNSDLGFLGGLAEYGPNLLGFTGPTAPLTALELVTGYSLSDLFGGDTSSTEGGVGGYGTTGAGASDPGVAGVPGGLAGRGQTGAETASSGGGGESDAGAASPSGGGGGPGTSGGPGTAGSDVGGSVGGPPGPGGGETGGFGESGTGGDTGSAGAGAGADTTVLCTALRRRGYLDRDVVRADKAYGAMVRRLDPDLYRGYYAWAQHYVRLMNRNDLIGALAVAAVVWWVMPWAHEMAFQMGARDRGNRFGRMIMAVLYPPNRCLGTLLRILKERRAHAVG